MTALSLSSGRPLWLVTLADLALLLVGFLVLMQVRGDRVAEALRARFAADDAAIAVSAERVGFAAGSASAGDLRAIRGWAAEQLRDPRITLTVTGSVDGSAADVDAATRSGELLAADRARAVAAAIASLSPARVRVRVATATGVRAVTVTLGFAGERTNR